MGSLFDTDAYRTRFIQALTFFLDEVDTGNRTPRQALQVIQDQTGMPKGLIAQIMAGECRRVSDELYERLEAFLSRAET